MKVSLKEARRIERRIQEKGIRKGYPLRANINIFSDVPVEVAIDIEAERVEETVELHANFIKARSAIRRQIQVTNETSGINELIAQREEYIRLLSLWEDILETAEDLKDGAIVARTVENKRERATNGKEAYYGSNSDTVEFVAVTDDLYAYAGEEARNCQHNIDACDDQLAALNATTKIELSTEIALLLSKQKII
jgi:hypothetical protein